MSIEIASKLIESSDGILITAGAGMSVDSGIPDFRGETGLWRQHARHFGSHVNYSDMATRGMLHTDPSLAWGFWGSRYNIYNSTIPHDGYSSLLRIANEKKVGAFVFTSNVDGQFKKAGFPDDRIVECHGSVHNMQCTGAMCYDTWSTHPFEPLLDESNMVWTGPFPVCEKCGSLARPNVLMFHDGPNWRGRQYVQREQDLKNWLSTVSRLCVVEIGAGSAIPTVRIFGSKIARQFGAPLIRINPSDTQLPSNSAIVISSGARCALSEIEANIFGFTQAA